MNLTSPLSKPWKARGGGATCSCSPGFLFLLGLFLVALGGTELCAQTNTQYISSGNLAPFRINVGLESATQPQEVDSAIKILFAITLLTLAPSILLLMTCFTRIVIVLSFVRTALSLPGTPANQVIIGLSIFLTYFIMSPVWGIFIAMHFSRTPTNRSESRR